MWHEASVWRAHFARCAVSGLGKGGAQAEKSADDVRVHAGEPVHRQAAGQPVQRLAACTQDDARVYGKATNHGRLEGRGGGDRAGPFGDMEETGTCKTGKTGRRGRKRALGICERAADGWAPADRGWDVVRARELERVAGPVLHGGVAG